jgi:hypothetical protein
MREKGRQKTVQLNRQLRHKLLACFSRNSCSDVPLRDGKPTSNRSALKVGVSVQVAG